MFTQFELGDDFVEVITSALGSCDVVLALIGDRGLTITDEDARRRLDKSDDFVRVQIEAALARKVRVIPILVGGARMPQREDRPPSLDPARHGQPRGTNRPRGAAGVPFYVRRSTNLTVERDGRLFVASDLIPPRRTADVEGASQGKAPS